MNRKKVSLVRLSGLIVLILCSGSTCKTIEGNTRGNANVELPPNYLLPNDQYVEADFNTLSSEFKDEYVNQYVTFTGTYYSHQQGVIIYSNVVQPKVYQDVMSANIGAPGALGSSRFIQAIWHVEDREIGRPFLEASAMSQVRIYGYVLPANSRAKIKSRQDMIMSGFNGITVLVIKVEPM